MSGNPNPPSLPSSQRNVSDPHIGLEVFDLYFPVRMSLNYNKLLFPKSVTQQIKLLFKKKNLIIKARTLNRISFLINFLDWQIKLKFLRKSTF